MQELLQSKSVAGSAEESLKAMLSQKLSMATTPQGMDFSQIFANATKKQKELSEFAASSAKTKTVQNSTTQNKLKNNNNINDNSKIQNNQTEDKKLKQNKTETGEKTENTSSKEEKTNVTNNEELEKVTSQLEEAANIAKETSIIEAIDVSNIDVDKTTTTNENKTTTTNENPNLKNETNLSTNQEVKINENIKTLEIDLANVEDLTETTTNETEDLTTINTKTTDKSTQTQKTNEIDLAEVDENDIKTEDNKALKAKIFVNSENIQNETDMTLDEITSSNEPSIEGIVEEKILKNLNLNVDEIMLGAKTIDTSTKLTGNASEQMFKMSLEKTFGGAKAETGSVQALQNNAASSNNGAHGENQSLNLTNQSYQNKVHDFKQATASASTKFSEVQKNDVLDQITAKFDQLKNNGTAKITLTLRPNDLGRVVIEMSQDKNGVSATILAQNEDVKKMLEQDIDGLKTKLAQAGVQVDNIAIKTPEGASNNSTLAQDFEDNSNNQREENSKENNSNQQNKNSNNQNYSENPNQHHERNYYQESLVENYENYENYEGIKVGNNGYIRTR